MTAAAIHPEVLKDTISTVLGERIKSFHVALDEVVVEINVRHYLEAMQLLRDAPGCRFEQLIDLCGVDYAAYGQDEWNTDTATFSGFSRGRQPLNRPAAGLSPQTGEDEQRRFAVVHHLLSVKHNRRLRLRTWCEPGEPPMVDSVIEIWKAADWFEREAFDLFGILFRGHPDLRRLLTDYGFIGHPFRKDFPLSGNVEVRYDPAKGRVVYEPVSIEPRTLVPRVIRDDNRYEAALKDAPKHGPEHG